MTYRYRSTFNPRPFEWGRFWSNLVVYLLAIAAAAALARFVGDQLSSSITTSTQAMFGPR